MLKCESFIFSCSAFRDYVNIKKGVFLKFKDLMDFPYNKEDGVIDIDFLREKLSDTPEDVLEQLYSEHGRKIDFQAQYNDINILEIEWKLVRLTALSILETTYYSDFSDYFQIASGKALQVSSLGWTGVSHCPLIRKQWEDNSTWLRPPVMFRKQIYSLGSDYHLAEGHTRVGLLKGLVDNAILPKNGKHSVWLGCPRQF